MEKAVSAKERTLGELKVLLEKIPRLGDEARRFEEDIKAIIKSQPSKGLEGRDRSSFM